jgi:hypothetical protein
MQNNLRRSISVAKRGVLPMIAELAPEDLAI